MSKPKGHKVDGKNVSGDSAMEKVIAAQAKMAELREENKALRKDRDQLVSEYNDMVNARKVKLSPSKVKPKGDTMIRVCAGDVHGMRCDKAAVDTFLSDVKLLDPDEVVLGGDIVDCGGWLAKHHTIGYVAEMDYSYQEDIAVANEFLDRLQEVAPRAVIHYLSGNHECTHPDHEVLTDEGWKGIEYVTESHRIASINEKREIVFDHPEKTHSYDFEGELVAMEGRSLSGRFTPNHRLAYYAQYDGSLKYREAQEMLKSPSSVVNIPSGGILQNREHPFTDDEIKLFTWIVTDGHINGHVGISQSNEDTIERITGILDRLGVEYTFRTRKRDIKEICGVKLKSCKDCGEFSFNSYTGRDLVRKYFGIEEWHYKERYIKRIPEWVGKLSKRQFDVFLQEVILADGSPASTGHSCYAVYGTKEFLSDLQRFCTLFGWRTCLKSRSRKGIHSYWVLNITERDNTKFSGTNFSLEKYKGPVYCLTMPQGNFVTRYKGTVYVTGNSRVERWITDQVVGNKRDGEFLREHFSPEKLLRLEKRGIKFYERDKIHKEGLPRGWIKLGKMHFTHSLSYSKNAARDAATKTAGNVTYWCSHRADTATVVLPNVGMVHAYNPGCMCTIQPIYRTSFPTEWSQGYGIDVISDDGNFQRIQVPIWRGKSLATAMIHRLSGR